MARQRIVLDLIRRTLGPGNSRPALDVGCGTAAFLKALSEEWKGWGLDTSELAVEYARRRGLSNVVQGTLDDLPNHEQRFDLITALDVIEHIENDEAVLREMGGRLTNGGSIVITVPAYPWLWSAHDEINHHYRRYTRETLTAAISSAGLRVEYVSYFNTLLFPLALIQRALARLTGRLIDDGLTVPAGWLNRTLQRVFESERHLVGTMSLPFGLSLVAVVRRT